MFLLHFKTMCAIIKHSKQQENHLAKYVDNERLYNAFISWYDARKIAAELGQPEPQPPPYISECVLAIPNNLASKGNFSGYSFREDMVGDAVENIIQYYRNFDPAKSKNPFAYLTQFAYYAFIRRIVRERKQSYIKHKLVQNNILLDSIITQDHDDADYQVSIMETLQNSLNPDLEAFFEPKKPPKVSRPVKSSPIEDLLNSI